MAAWPGGKRVQVGVWATAANDKEVAVLTLSILHLVQSMASQVEVPAEDMAQTRAVPGWESAHAKERFVPLAHIRSSKAKPADAFVSIRDRQN